MNKRNNLITPENASKVIPLFISSCISILLIIFFLIPNYLKSNKVNLELNAMNIKKNELDKLKSQYKIINQKFVAFNKEKLAIIDLISGTSNLDTLLAKLGEIGKKNNVEFISIVPKKIIRFTENKTKGKKNKNNNQVNLVVDPLLVEGTKKYILDVNLKTDFNNLLLFLRELEFLENVILLDEMNLKLNDQNSNNLNIDNKQRILDIKFSMTFYGKI